ncbi:MAG: ribosome small subunit-dependent GTPase A [Eggerthellaceae bacterium]|nr:ribosome small subunit-dependent GTPase A [Eggerthellaceae bacterium]
MGERGVVVKLDRGFPLVRLASGEDVRCEHATALVKGERVRAAIGDRVSVALPDEHDKGIIEAIEPRRTAFVRKDPAERTTGQVLAANFDTVVVVEPIVQLNRKRLERELVLAHETGARVVIVLTKVDLADAGEARGVLDDVAALAGRDVAVMGTSAGDEASIACVRSCIPAGETAILIGKSGVGKSTLVNRLAGRTLQETASVRERDGKGRHTTVDRVMIEVPGGGTIVDMPGVRGLGLWEADQGLGAAFPDVEALAAKCRFRDCMHGDEPGCAVRAAVEAGELATARVESYRSLAAEIADVRTRRKEASHLRGEKASDRKKRSRRKSS